MSTEPKQQGGYMDRKEVTSRQQRLFSDVLDDPVSSAPVQTRSRQERFVKPLLRFARYTAVRLLTLFFAVVMGLYLTLLVAELGGKIDEVRRDNIAWIARMAIFADPENAGKSTAERFQLANELIAVMESAAGLDRPIMLRVAEWLPQGLTLQLGESRSIRSITYRPQSEQRVVRILILERIPNTLLLLGVTNLAFFFMSVWMGLFLSRRYRSWLDKLFVLLSPLSTAPSWFYGIFLLAIFAGILGWLPFGGMFPSPPPDSRYLYYLGMLERMILPFAAVFLSVFFYSVYMWRTFFLIYSSEDYVDMAQAKGLPDKLVERRYILRPTLPPIITMLVVIIIEIWGGSIILERLFNWPGLGDLYFEAILRMDTAVIVGLTIIYAYFLALTIFTLDLAYAFLDPRIRLGSDSHGALTMSRSRHGAGWRRFWPFAKRPLAAPARRHLASPTKPRRSPLATLQYTVRDMANMLKQTPRLGRQVGHGLWQLRRYPTALAGLSIIFILLGSIVYTVRTIPLAEAIQLWRGDETRVQENPRYARPLWFNFFSQKKLPATIVMDNREGDGEKTVTVLPEFTEIVLTYTFDFMYDDFPQEPVLYFYLQQNARLPLTTMTWITPDGREIQLGQQSPRHGLRHRFSEDRRLLRRLGGATPQQGLFADPNAAEPVPLKGEYQLQIHTLMFDEAAEFDAKFILYGQVHGWAGTDSRRRDLSVPLLWGVPIALSFGLLAALGTTVLTMIIAAVGVWWGGWLGNLIQRLTEINMVLPVFPVLAMYTAFFTVRIWEVLGLAILFSIFGSGIKTYHALFLQVKESSYVEAAQAYGASNLRIVLLYLIPRVAPILIPQIMILVPTYVFLEAALAFLGLSDLYLPTWGKVINDAHMAGALVSGHYYWILQPAVLLMLTAFAFAMLGFALDRIFNPRLRQM
jgi:peptide/nickel transport system permease protein